MTEYRVQLPIYQKLLNQRRNHKRYQVGVIHHQQRFIAPMQIGGRMNMNVAFRALSPACRRSLSHPRITCVARRHDPAHRSKPAQLQLLSSPLAAKPGALSGETIRSTTPRGAPMTLLLYSTAEARHTQI